MGDTSCTPNFLDLMVAIFFFCIWLAGLAEYTRRDLIRKIEEKIREEAAISADIQSGESFRTGVAGAPDRIREVILPVVRSGQLGFWEVLIIGGTVIGPVSSFFFLAVFK